MRIGVFICHCGSNIGGTVDCAKVAETARAYPDVVYAVDLMYSCAEPGQAATLTAILDLAPWANALQYLQAEVQTVAARVENELLASVFASVPLDQRPPDMSATEFLERKREALQQLGPVMSAYEPNVLTPLLWRVAGMLDRAGLLPPPPEEPGLLEPIPLEEPWDESEPPEENQ